MRRFRRYLSYCLDCKIVTRSWRNKSVPTCPHCGRASKRIASPLLMWANDLPTGEVVYTRPSWAKKQCGPVVYRRKRD